MDKKTEKISELYKKYIQHKPSPKEIEITVTRPPKNKS